VDQKSVRTVVPEESQRSALSPPRLGLGLLPLRREEVSVVVHRWSHGKSPLDSQWTEFMGRIMEAHETPEDVYIKFNHWLKTGEWIVCQCCPAR